MNSLADSRSSLSTEELPTMTSSVRSTGRLTAVTCSTLNSFPRNAHNTMTPTTSSNAAPSRHPTNRAIESLEQFLKTVWETEPPKHTHVRLYRGQTEVNPLLPSLFRPPNTVSKVRAIEPTLLSSFKNDSPYLLPSKPDNDWDWLSLAQHFRLPTRLLDWTANPLTALLFAVESNKPKSPTVYIYDGQKNQIVTAEERKELSPFEIDKTRIFQPSWHSVRVAMQAGWHTVHHIYAKHGMEFRPLQDMEFHEKRTVEISIDPSRASHICLGSA